MLPPWLLCFMRPILSPFAPYLSPKCHIRHPCLMLCYSHYVLASQMVTYQSIDLTAGDVKRHTRDKYAIFQVSPSPLGSAPDSFIQSKDKSKQPPPVESGIPMTASWREGPSVGAERALDVAVEICLDHRDVRLRRNIGNHPFHVQLIPSCGMQIKENGAAVEEGGLIFNVDGQ